MATKQPPKLTKARATRMVGETDSQKRKAAQKEAAIMLAEQVYAYKLIARGTGMSEDALKQWRDSDQQFTDELEKARTRFLQKRIKLARPEFLLERLEPDLFKLRTDITSGDKPLPSALVEFVDGHSTTSQD